MRSKSTETGTESRPAWERLEALAGRRCSGCLQTLGGRSGGGLGPAPYERRDGRSAAGLPKRWGKPRRLSAMAGTITVRPARVRLEARFESRLLPLFKRRTEAVAGCAGVVPHDWPRAILNLGCGDCSGRRRRCRRPSNCRLKASWQVEYEKAGSAGGWTISSRCTVGGRDLHQARAGEGQGRRCFVLIAAPGRTEVSSWRWRAGIESRRRLGALLRDLKARGVAGAAAAHCRRALGIGARWAPCSRRSASSGAGPCLVTRARHAPEAAQGRRGELLTKIPTRKTRAEADAQKRSFQAWATRRASPPRAPADEDWGDW